MEDAIFRQQLHKTLKRLERQHLSVRSEPNDNEKEIPYHDGMVLLRNEDPDHLSAVQVLIETAERYNNHGDSRCWTANQGLLNDHILARIPAFCGLFTWFVNMEYVREQIVNAYGQSSHSAPQACYIDDIWHYPVVMSWVTADESRILGIQGVHGPSPRLALFGAKLASDLRQTSSVIYASGQPVGMVVHGKLLYLVAAQLLRHAAIEALRQLPCPLSVSFMAEIIRDFDVARHTETCMKDWFDILLKILSSMDRVYIILHLATHEAITAASGWLQDFDSLLSRVRERSPLTRIGIAIITEYPMWHPQSDERVVVVGDAQMPPNSQPDGGLSRPEAPHRAHTSREVTAARNSPPPRSSSSSMIERAPPYQQPKSPAGSDTWAIVRPDEDKRRSTAFPPSEASQDHVICETPPQSYQKMDMGPVHLRTPNAIAALPPPAHQNRPRPSGRGQFSVAIFCALPLEATVVIRMFDQIWDRKEYGKAPGDRNYYTLGAMGNVNVVLVHLREMGKSSAASHASYCRMSFTGIRLALVVGICGGVPFGPDGQERILGDVVISSGLVQYDFGRQYTNEFDRKKDISNSLSRPSAEIRGFLAMLEVPQSQAALYQAIRRASARVGDDKMYEYPGRSADIIHPPSYLHKHQQARDCPSWAETCSKAGAACSEAREADCRALRCDGSQAVVRKRLEETDKRGLPVLQVHIGKVASGDKVMKSGEERDRIAADENIIAFEMEGAGVWDEFPCIVVKGICDYADSHKSKEWQHFAAGTASACARALLEQWD